MNKCVSFILVMLFLVSCHQKKDARIWLHRVNTQERLIKYQYKYSGIELDVHFIDSVGGFVVKHDRLDTTHFLLEEYLESLDNKAIGIWFDFRNSWRLSEKDQEKSLKELNRLKEKNQLQGQLYVESHSIEVLEKFYDSNYTTSYYISEFDETTSDETLDSIKNLIKEAVLNPKVNCISGNYNQKDKVEEWFPQKSKLFWNLGFDVDYHQMQEVLDNDSTIKIILVSDEERKHSDFYYFLKNKLKKDF